MTSDFDSMMAADLLAAETELTDGEDTWSFGGTSYPGIVGDISDARDVGLPGYITNASGVIIARMAALTSGVPDPGTIVASGGTSYRVRETIPSADGISAMIVLEDLNQ